MSSVTPEVNSELSELANVTQHSVNTFVMEATEVSLNLTERVFCLNLTKKYWCLNFPRLLLPQSQLQSIRISIYFLKNNKADEVKPAVDCLSTVFR